MAGRESLDRDAVVAGVDLASLADALLGRRRGSSASPSWLCPVDAHDQGSAAPAELTIFTTRRGDQRWSCQNCGTDGSAIDLVMHARRLGFRASLEFLAQQQGAQQPYCEVRDPAHRSRRATTSTLRRTGLDGWVDRASGLLWEPFGDRIRSWLTSDRGLPADILKLHRIGATTITQASNSASAGPLSVRSASSPAAVLPVVAKGRVIFTQLRLIDASAGDGRYIHPRSGTTHDNPRIGLFRPGERRHDEIIVTEGIIDALSANVAGYRAAALLSPGLADAATAVHLSRLAGPLVLAFDPDESGTAAADRLSTFLWARGRRPSLLAELGHDLNDSLVRAGDFPRMLAAHVRQAVAAGPPDHVPGL